MDLNFNLFNIIIFAGVVQGFIFGIVVLTSKGFNNKSNRYLAYTILSLSLNNLYYWLVDTGFDKNYSGIHLFYFPWHLIFPVTFYIYVLDYVGKKKPKIFIWLLFSPFLTSAFLHLIINVFLDFKNNIPYWVKLFYISEEYAAFLIAIYVGFSSFRLLKEAKKTDSKINVYWLKILLRTGLILCIIWVVIYTLSIKFNLDGLKLYYPIWIGISIMFYWIGYRGLYQFKLAKDRKAINLVLDEVDGNLDIKYQKVEEDEKYDITHPLFVSFKQLVENKRVYRKQELTLDEVAKILKTNRSTLSKVINQASGKKYTDFINDYRIEEAKLLLENPDFDKYKISAVGFEVGFNHISTFYDVFKKHTGVTPSKYRQNR